MRQTCESERENGGNNDAERERTSESEIEDLGAQLDKACASRPLDRAQHGMTRRTAATHLLTAVLWLATRTGGTGHTAVLRYGDPQVEQRIDLRKDADYDIDTGTYTVHLHVENGGIAFVNSPCPDHLCEGFGILQNAGDWAACMPARTSITIEEK